MEEIRTIDIFEYLRHRLTQQPLDFIALLISPFHALNVEAFVNELAEVNPDVQGEIIIIPHLKHGIMVKNFYFLFKDHPNINFIVARPHAFERHDERLFQSIIKNAQTSLLEIKKITRYPLKSVYFLSPLSHLSALNLCIGLFDVKLWKLYQPIFVAYDEGGGSYLSAKATEGVYKKDLQDNQYKGLFTFWQAVNSIFSVLSPQIQQLNQDNFFYITKRYLLDREGTKFKLNSHITNSFKKLLQKRAEENPLNFTPVDVLFSTSPLEEYNYTSSLKADEFRQQVIKFFLEKDLTIGIKPHPAEKIEKYEKVLKKFPKEKVFLFSPSLITEDILFQLPVKYVVSLWSTVLLTAKICDVVPIIIHPDLIGSNTHYHTQWEECKRVVEATVEGELSKGKKGGLAFFSWKEEGSLFLPRQDKNAKVAALYLLPHVHISQRPFLLPLSIFSSYKPVDKIFLLTSSKFELLQRLYSFPDLEKKIKIFTFPSNDVNRASEIIRKINIREISIQGYDYYLLGNKNIIYEPEELKKALAFISQYPDISIWSIKQNLYWKSYTSKLDWTIEMPVLFKCSSLNEITKSCLIPPHICIGHYLIEDEEQLKSLSLEIPPDLRLQKVTYSQLPLILKKVCTPLDTHIPNKKVAIVVVNYQCPLDTINCLQSIFSAAYKNFQIILVDNASKDNSIEIILEHLHKMGIDVYTDQEEFCFKPKTVVFITNQTNLGFAGGANIGIKIALKNKVDYIWLLNPDTKIDKDALVELVKLAEKDEKVGIVGSKIYCYTHPQKVQFWGERFVAYGEGVPDTKDFPKPVNFISGTSLLLKKELIEKIGFLEEDYFFYYDDNDIVIRAIKTGWEVWYNPYSKVYHKGGETAGRWLKTPFSIYYAVRNELLFNYKHFPQVFLASFERVKNTYFMINHKLSLVYAYLKGVEDFVYNQTGKAKISFDKIDALVEELKHENPPISWKTLPPKERLKVLEVFLILNPTSQEYLNAFLEEAKNLYYKNIMENAEAHFQKGEEQKAIQMLDHLLTSNSSYAPAHNALAFIFWHKKEVEKALYHITKALELAPDDRDIIWNCGQIMLSLGRTKDAYDIYKRYLQKHPQEIEIKKIIEEIEKEML